ncbi:MAG: hypothetical protein ACRCYP_01245 [Alphaproteobacteria bacterium]
MKQFSKLSAIRLSMLALVLSTPVNAMMKHRYNPQHGQVTDTVVAQKPSSRKETGTPEERRRNELKVVVQSLEGRINVAEENVRQLNQVFSTFLDNFRAGNIAFQASPSLAETQETPTPASKPDQGLKSPSTPSTLRRWFSLRRKGQEENPQKKSSSTIPTPPILPVISAPLPPSPSLPKAKPVVVVIPLPPRLPAATPSVMAPPPPPPLQDNLLLSYVAEQPSGQKSFMEELQHKKLKPFEGEKNCSSPESDVQEELMKEMKAKQLKPSKKREAAQTPAQSQPNELEKKLAIQRRLIDQS